eukprot:1515533-Alexandrium_andersonii.AAC.1
MSSRASMTCAGPKPSDYGLRNASARAAVSDPVLRSSARFCGLLCESDLVGQARVCARMHASTQAHK